MFRLKWLAAVFESMTLPVQWKMTAVNSASLEPLSPHVALGIKQGEREGKRDGDHVAGWLWMRQAPCDWLSTGLSSFLYGNRRNQAIGFAPAIMPMNAEWNGGSPLWPQSLTRHLALLRTHTPPFIAGLRLKLVTSWGFTHRAHTLTHTHTKQHLLGIKQWLGLPVLPSAGENKQPGETAVCCLAVGIWAGSGRGKALALYRLSKLECEGMKPMNKRLVLSLRFALKMSRLSGFC